MKSNNKPYSDYTLDGCESLSIHNITKQEVIDFFNLEKGEFLKWEEASGKCLGKHVMILSQNDWITLAGPTRWFYKFLTDVKNQNISSHDFINEAITLITYLSSKFGRTIFSLESNNYGVFEKSIAEDGKFISGYYHGDGETIEEFDFTNQFPLEKIPPPIEIAKYHYNKQILEGIQLYKFKDR